MPDLKGRENWASRLGFILAAAGSAVGLGNIWRFPFVVGTNGGAVFVLIYLVIVIFIGYPLMVTETVVGRAGKRNPVGAFQALAPNSPWWLAGALGVFTGFLILSYYSVVGGWSLAYVIKALTGEFTTDADFVALFTGHISLTIAPIIWHAVFMVLTVAIIAGGVVKGIQRWVQFLWPVMAVLIVILIIRALTLEGSGAGIAFLFRPDFSEITARTFLDAIAQSFFTLSLGMGVFITYGSYLSDRDNVPSSAATVVGLDTGIAILAGLVIFPAVFAFGFEPGAGAGLAFITLPAVFAEMPVGTLFGTSFFLLLSLAALTSAISLLEVVASWLIDEKGWTRKSASAVLGAVIFVVGIPASLGFSAFSGFAIPGIGDLFDTYDWIANSILLPLGGLLTAVFAGYVWKAKSARAEANKDHMGMKIGEWYGPALRYVVPLAIILVMAFGIIDTFV
ncbi:MAG: sodium-dependent transporter [Spirochaetaceae bacterium]|nr:MAG: sodium-dependent transporter [Spirochaetaceae bacterium]